jgi:hypothetical protein
MAEQASLPLDGYHSEIMEKDYWEHTLEREGQKFHQTLRKQLFFFSFEKRKN